MPKPLLSTHEAAEELGVSRQRVQQLIDQGRLKAVKIGGALVIQRADLRAVRKRTVGRPPAKKKRR